MNVLITVPCYLPSSSNIYSAGTVAEIPNEWLNPNVMTRIGTVSPLLASRISLVPVGSPPVAAN
jgi:hypothetical protein